jgi:hypothetical protein
VTCDSPRWWTCTGCPQIFLDTAIASGRLTHTRGPSAWKIVCKKTFKTDRLIPYIQLHEFEALLFSDVHMFEIAFPNRPAEVEKLKSIREDFLTPEHINDQPDRSPSKRILKVIPEYVKTVSGILIIQHIGLPVLRKECGHFGRWLDQLEQLAMV